MPTKDRRQGISLSQSRASSYIVAVPINKSGVTTHTLKHDQFALVCHHCKHVLDSKLTSPAICCSRQKGFNTHPPPSIKILVSARTTSPARSSLTVVHRDRKRIIGVIARITMFLFADFFMTVVWLPYLITPQPSLTNMAASYGMARWWLTTC